MDATKQKYCGAKKEYSFSNKHILVQMTICNSVRCIDIPTVCTVAVSVDEQLPEDGLVRLKHVAIRCDFNDILKQRRDFEWFMLH
jgi:hypothetical protein